ncbi:cytochrome c biogenesis protein CcsA [Spongiibacter sp. KMU-166]|uniref:Cytochrome c biogenesis protein CcsA n=1 Tax=Spongiibacter thalassae TaxID=2721624 RepID=A0ABX1GCN1_9GAMM|nr:cytochrome c biogenesis protein CcsA [Spongiibacter thalassae]NKI16911.1 cytochrome c biogenesis protein CcsA [Spongiibacter thalassae]
MNTASSLIAIALYLLATLLQVRRLQSDSPSGSQHLSRGSMASGLFAVVSHGVAAVTAIATPQGADLGLAQVLSLLSGLICLIILLTSFRRPLHNLLLAMFPLAALTLLIEVILPGNPDKGEQYSIGMYSHILLSILAYSTITVAAVQAIVLAGQDRMLRQHQLRGLPSLLPPLQTMEAMLFELITAGVLLLTLAILTGALYVENLLAQHLLHKTVFSVIAWILLSTLLCGRVALGWRGRTAIRWTLWAFASLLLGYIGTKIALLLISP